MLQKHILQKTFCILASSYAHLSTLCFKRSHFGQNSSSINWKVTINIMTILMWATFWQCQIVSLATLAVHHGLQMQTLYFSQGLRQDRVSYAYSDRQKAAKREWYLLAADSGGVKGKGWNFHPAGGAPSRGRSLLSPLLSAHSQWEGGTEWVIDTGSVFQTVHPNFIKDKKCQDWWIFS